jgi:hypothetical protein
MKIDTDTGRALATRRMSPMHGGIGRRKDLDRLDHARISSAELGMKKNEKGVQEHSRFKLIVAVEQWMCLALGVVCVASGIWGVLLKVGRDGCPARLAWLASAYVPTLRITAIACLVMGLLLVRRGLAQV